MRLRAVGLATAAAVAGTVPLAAVAVILSRALGATLRVQDALLAAAAIAVAVAAQIALAGAAGVQMRVLLARAAERARVDVVAHLRRVPARALAGVDPGRTVALVTTELDDSVAAAGGAFDALAGSLASAVFAAGIVAFVDWRIALLAIAFVPVVAGYLRASRGISARATPRLARARAESTSRFFEFVESIALLRAFGRTAERARRFAWAQKELQRKTFESGIAPMPFGTLVLFFIEFGFAITVMAGAELGVAGPAAGARFILALAIAIFYFQTLYDAADGYLRLQDAQAIGRRIAELLALPAPAGTSLVALPASRELALADVAFAYDRGPVLHGISHRFPERGLSVIVGRSGSGKSALAGVIAGLWDPSAGRVTVGGVDLWSLAPDARTRLVTLVLQETDLLPGTILDNIVAGRPGAGADDVRRAARAAGCDAFVARLPRGYDTAVRAGGLNLSLGERQRIAIARALLSDAPVVVFDECTASLDADAERAVRDAVTLLAERKTVLVITHRLGSVRAARRIVVLAAGAIAESGTHDELLALDGEYARLWAAYERTRPWRTGVPSPGSAPQAASA